MALNGLMGVAANDCVETRPLRFQVEVVEIMKHIEAEAGGFNHGRARKLLRLRVHVAPHGKDGCDKFQLRENLGSAHVSRMNNEVDTEQRALCFRAEQAVGIGNDADPHGH